MNSQHGGMAVAGSHVQMFTFDIVNNNSESGRFVFFFFIRSGWSVVDRVARN